jgi:hypothetical protein
MFETFESRRLLSSGVTVSQSGSSLEVKGGADGSVIRVNENAGTVVVEDSGTVIGTFAGISAIKITGQAKNDQLFYRGNTVGAVMSGGGGDDQLTVEDNGAVGSHVSGDGGADDINIHDANNTTVVGDGGNDILTVHSSVVVGRNVHLYGMGGSDFFFIHGGTNYVYGGGGTDYILQTGGVIVVADSASPTGS